MTCPSLLGFIFTISARQFDASRLEKLSASDASALRWEKGWIAPEKCFLTIRARAFAAPLTALFPRTGVEKCSSHGCLQRHGFQQARLVEAFRASCGILRLFTRAEGHCVDAMEHVAKPRLKVHPHHDGHDHDNSNTTSRGSRDACPWINDFQAPSRGKIQGIGISFSHEDRKLSSILVRASV